MLRHSIFSDQIISIRFCRQPFHIIIIYHWYRRLIKFMVKGNLKSTEHVLLMVGNWNAKVGNGRKENVVGLYGLGNRKEAGESHSFLFSNGD